jgi:hypothetical protein
MWVVQGGRRRRPPATSVAEIDAGTLRRQLTAFRVLTAAVVGGAAVCPSFVWAIMDKSIWPWDPAWYGQVSVDLWATLHLDPGRWPSAMDHAFGSKPPGIAWFGQFFVPLGSAVGRVPLFALVGTLLCEGATVAIVFATVRRLTTKLAAALLAALIVAGAPLFVSVGHEYVAEPLQGLSVAWLLYALASACAWRRSLTVACIFASVGLGLLAKLSTPFYMVFPATVALLLAVLRPGSGRGAWFRDLRVVAVSVAGMLLWLGDLGWYATNWAAARAHADTLNSTLYGGHAALGTKLHWWLPHFDQALFPPFFDLAAAAAVGASVGLAIWRRSAVSVPTLATTVSSVATVGFVLLLLALHPVNEIRYTFPLIVCAGVAVATVVSIARVRLLTVATAVVFLAEFGIVAAQGFGSGLARRSYPAITRPTSPVFNRALEAVVRETCTPETNGRINVVGGDFAFFNANTLAFLADTHFASSGRRCYYTPLGYAETSVDRAWHRVLQFQPPYYVSLDYGNPENRLPPAQRAGVGPGDAFNVVDQRVFHKVATSPHFEVVPASRILGLVVFKGHWS